ncbi:MAG: efflux RND transporter periplasmic adaptor subunit, partial [Pseudomonadota bacterium]|nr:efflux RND transporter periplasmic adaptor subunit [Pseudomonadota bacterium]
QLAQSTAKRWQNLLKTNSVSKQEADEKSGDAAAKAAAVASAQANLERLKQLEGFQEITAPFDGTITARNTDTGALINAGSGGTGAELFHIAETDKLRVYVQVPETYSAYITPAMKAELHFTEHADESFMGVLIRTADAIDPVTRTLLMELEVENASNRLLPGSYVEVHLKLAASGRSVHIPVNTLLFRAAGLQVAVVDTEGKARLRSITVGRDYGKEVEVASGLSAGETIIANPPDSLLDGQTVKPVKQAPKSPSDQKPGGQPEDGKASAEKPAAGTQAADKPVPATPLPQEGKSDKGDHKP